MEALKLLPVEPDDAMIEAGEEEIASRGSLGCAIYASDVYEAMVRAYEPEPDVPSTDPRPAAQPLTEGEPSDAEVERASQAVVAEWKKMVAEMHPHLSVADAARAFVSPGNYRLIRAILLAAKSKGGQADG